MDELFEDMFAEHTAEELDAIKKRWATRGNVMEAPKLIAAKAREHAAPLRGLRSAQSV